MTMASLEINLDELTVYKLAVEKLLEIVEYLKGKLSLTHVVDGMPTENGKYIVAYHPDPFAVDTEVECWKECEFTIMDYVDGKFGWIGTEEDPEEFSEDDGISVIFWTNLPKIPSSKEEYQK